MNSKTLYIHDWFSQTAEKFWNNTAVDCGEWSITYGMIEEQSNKLANFLISCGADKSSLVAICSEYSVEVIIAIIGILKAGCIFVPLAPELPEQRINTILSKFYIRWFVVDSKGLRKLGNLEGLKSSQPQFICLKLNPGLETFTLGFNSLNYHVNDYAEYANVDRPCVRLEPDDMCYLYFTSGSTGKPKGIAGRLKAIAHFINWEIKTFCIGESTRVSQLINPSFDAFLRDVFVPLCSGGVVCVPEDINTILDARKLIEWIDHQRINLIHCVPSLFRSLLHEDLNSKKFSSLQYILLAGEPLPPTDVSRWMDVYGER